MSSIIKLIVGECPNDITIDVKNRGTAEESIEFFKNNKMLCVMRCCYAQAWLSSHEWFVVKQQGFEFNVKRFARKLDAARYCISLGDI